PGPGHPADSYPSSAALGPQPATEQDPGLAELDLPLPGRPPTCCAATRSRVRTDGGDVLILTVHAFGCPVWAAR
ncbi:hypothetical protein ACIQOV_21835, partial [Kitasatospora sp. NPDC091257]